MQLSLIVTGAGFKSFREAQSFGPLSSMTCIIGSNGTGKSALGEAIAFVLGSSAKVMRAGDLENLINVSTDASGGFCKVCTTHLMRAGMHCAMMRILIAHKQFYPVNSRRSNESRAAAAESACHACRSLWSCMCHRPLPAWYNCRLPALRQGEQAR